MLENTFYRYPLSSAVSYLNKTSIQSLSLSLICSLSLPPSLSPDAEHTSDKGTMVRHKDPDLKL
jgi:hypothetical protein